MPVRRHSPQRGEPAHGGGSSTGTPVACGGKPSCSAGSGTPARSWLLKSGDPNGQSRSLTEGKRHSHASPLNGGDPRTGVALLLQRPTGNRQFPTEGKRHLRYCRGTRPTQWLPSCRTGLTVSPPTQLAPPVNYLNIRAMTKAAVADKPPIRTVCLAPRSGLVPVKRPLM